DRLRRARGRAIRSPHAVLVARDVLDAAPGRHALGPRLRERRVVRGARELVASLDEEPALPGVARPTPPGLQGPPAAVQLLAGGREREPALLHAGARVVDRLPRAVVPDDDAPAAILALGDHAFEVRVVDRMILGLHREALLGRIEARALRHRP